MKKFLIGQLASFGDCLYATAIAKQIKNDYPESHITWAVAAKYKSILKLNPHVDAIWEVEFLPDDNNLTAWRKFKNKALQRKANGEFDEIIFSPIAPDNWIHFNGTIRGSILSS